MLTRSKTNILQSLLEIKSNVLPLNSYMNLVTLYYKSNKNPNMNIIKLCLNDIQYNKIRNKRIIIYNNEDYDSVELLGNEKIIYNQNVLQQYNNPYNYIIESIENNILDDVTIDMLIDDNDIEAAKILAKIKYM
jgi:hypothetical protein